MSHYSALNGQLRTQQTATLYTDSTCTEGLDQAASIVLPGIR